MRTGVRKFVSLCWMLAACSTTRHDVREEEPRTTSGAIALANLDAEIAREADEPGVEDLLLLRARFLADDTALDRAVTLAESRVGDRSSLLRRARARSAVHRFQDALKDVESARHSGASPTEVLSLRASILVALGRAEEVVPALEDAVTRRPTNALRTGLAAAYASLGRFTEADRAYAEALAGLDTTSPFPSAWIQFARGTMWAEQAGEPGRGEQLLARAVSELPEFVTANVHLAELEAARGDPGAAMARLERVTARSRDPEALAALGVLHAHAGEPVRGGCEILLARERFESLLERHPQAFADHAAEFYLGPGEDPERAWILAQANLAVRVTERSMTLALRAARATRRQDEACALLARLRNRSEPFSASRCLE